MKFWRTNYYLPGHSTEIALTSEPASLKGRFKILGNEDDELLSDLMNVGFANWIKKNRLYWQVIENLSIIEMTNDEMYNFIVQPEALQEELPFQHHVQSFLQNEQESIDEAIMEKVVRLRLEQKWSICSLMAKFKLSQSQISSIFNTV